MACSQELLLQEGLMFFISVSADLFRFADEL
jgi:hypothetical protein